MQKSNYTYQIDGNVLFIEDKGGKFMSVTNNIENVLAEIDEDLKKNFQSRLDNYDVIYRDTEGIIDGILKNGSTMVDFYPIREESYHAAKLKIRKQ